MPYTTAPTLRFRLTGRHHAAGVYHPVHDNIAVDPDHPSSFVHEYCHHLDFTADKDGRPLSSGVPWVRDAGRVLQTDAGFGELSTRRSADYWLTPTEIVARSGEMYLQWRGIESSLNGSVDQHRGVEYATLEGLRPQITQFWDGVFAEHGGR